MALSQADLDALFTAAGGVAALADSPTAQEPVPPPRTSAPSTPTPDPDPPAGPPELERLLHLHVPIIVKLAERDMSVESILKLTVGSVLEFDRSAESELDLVVTDQTIGAGEAVKIGENFGLRITRIGTPVERIRAMGR